MGYTGNVKSRDVSAFMSDLNEIQQRSAYSRFYIQGTRWSDNDVYGHINNVVYYSLFDTTVNRFLINECGLRLGESEVEAYVVSSACDYFSSSAYPSDLEVGLRVNKLGNSSVEYGLAVFEVDSQVAKAAGRFTHVFVDKETKQATAIPNPIRDELSALLRN